MKEDTIRNIHAQNIGGSVMTYTIMSFKNLQEEAERVADFSYGKIAITHEQRKRPGKYNTIIV